MIERLSIVLDRAPANVVLVKHCSLSLVLLLSTNYTERTLPVGLSEQ
jgi:hypothetical protein